MRFFDEKKMFIGEEISHIDVDLFCEPSSRWGVDILQVRPVSNNFIISNFVETKLLWKV